MTGAGGVNGQGGVRSHPLSILVIHDGNPVGTVAVDYAAQLAATSEARLVIAIPICRPPGLASLVDCGDLRGELERAAEKDARDALRTVPTGVPTTVRMVRRSHERDLADEVTAGRYDLVVSTSFLRQRSIFDLSLGTRRFVLRIVGAAWRAGVRTYTIPRAEPPALTGTLDSRHLADAERAARLEFAKRGSKVVRIVRRLRSGALRGMSAR